MSSANPTVPAAAVASPAWRGPVRSVQRGLLRGRILGAPVVSRKRKALAFTIAAAADLIQMVLWPAFAEGAASPFDDALDAAVALALLLTLGWSGRLLAALALELTPGAALFPTWTAVVASIPSEEEVDRVLAESARRA